MKDPVRILLVDDSPYFLEAAREFLTIQESLTVVDVASEEREALAKSLAGAPDVILLDLNLAHGSGLELIPLFRNHLPKVKVIVLTMMDDESYRTAAFKAGADAFVRKTEMSRILVSTILDMMERAQSKPSGLVKNPPGREAGFLRLVDDLPDLVYRYEFAPKRGFTYVNPSATQMTGYTPEEHYADPDLGFKLVHPDDIHLLQAVVEGKADMSETLVLRWVRKDGSIFWTEQRNVPIFDAQGNLIALEGIARDITERKRAEEERRESDERYRLVLKNSMDAILLTAPDGAILSANPAACAMFERTEDEICRLGRNGLVDLGDPRLPILLEERERTGRVKGELTMLRKDGSGFPVELSSSVFTDRHGVTRTSMIIRDITERKQIEHALQQAEQKYRGIFENAMEGIHQTTREGKYITVNPAAARILGYDTPEELMSSVNDLNTRFYVEAGRREEFINLMEAHGSVSGFESQVYRKDGSRVWVSENAHTVCDEHGALLYYEGTSENITERRQAEEELRQSEDRYRDLVENIHDLIGTHDLQGNILSINPAASKLLGIENDALTKKNLRDILAPEARDQFDDYLSVIQRDGQASGLMFVQTVGGEIRIWEYDNTLRRDGVSGPIVRAKARDITERKQAEERLRESEERYHQLLEVSPVGIAVHSEGRLVFTNPAGARIIGADKPEDVIGRSIQEIIHPHNLAAARERIQRMLAGEKGLYPVEDRYLRLDGSEVPVEVMAAPLIFNDKPAVQVIVQDITDRRRSEEQIRRQLERLNGLRDIDLAISSSSDIRLTLDIVLQQVTSLLNVDAAAILLINPAGQTMDHAASRGFRSGVLHGAQLRLDEGYAGRAIRERRTVHIPELLTAGGELAKAMAYANENFADYFGVPLIAKGELKGVLEIFNRSRLDPDLEWLDYLETLGGQAAIAIDNAQLFGNLQRSNQEMMIAYDATIAGWSHAMDLRDKETEGHTQRVTDLTIQLAKRLGVSQQELIHIRRGALLHDIGKLGVPDHILLKPGKLKDEEWEIMRRHPAYAYEMLLPIHYLKPALDIPYCHHEKWDGSGYPHGLKGGQIPLPARIFAVVDVWDALRSDRPYRRSWSVEKVRGYILAESGKHFDPQVVEAFIAMLDESPEIIK